MRSTKWALGIVVAILVVPAAASVTVAVAPAVSPLLPPSLALLGSGPGSALTANTVSSTNWAGYAVTGATGSVTFVQGSWVQPTVTCSRSTTYSAFWVGIDGYSSRTVEQTGTEADCSGGTAIYSAWYEFYPAYPVTFTKVVVHPGDVFEASVTFAGGKFTATIKDVTTGTSGHHTKAVSTAKRTSAEWIAEAPYSGGVLPLADFGTAHFGKDATSVAATNEATISGTTSVLGLFSSSSIHQINMKSGGVTKALTSAVTPDGTSFNITWKHS
jgi:Peptidase A4 family